MAKEDFNKWMVEGLEKGYIQEMDKQFRKQYDVTEECNDEQWEDALKHFKKKKPKSTSMGCDNEDGYC